MKIGIVALSFGKPSEEAASDPVNYRLSTHVRAAHDQVTRKRQFVLGGMVMHVGGVKTVVVAQQEVAHYLGDFSQVHDLTIITDANATPKKNDHAYLDTQDVLNQAFRVFANEDVREVIVVAHPFLHAQAARRIVRQAGFIQHEFRIDDWVGFDSSQNNLQWWCRGPIRFLIYLAIQVVGKVIGKDFHGIGERHESHA